MHDHAPPSRINPNKKQTDNTLFIVPFNAKISDGCDYAVGTVTQIAADHQVIAIALGDPLGIRDILRWGRSGYEAVHRIGTNGRLVRPLFLIPGQRFSWMKRLNYRLNGFFLRLYIRVRLSPKRIVLWFFEPLWIEDWASTVRPDIMLYDRVDHFGVLGGAFEHSDSYWLTHADLIVTNSRTVQRELADGKRPVRFSEWAFTDTYFHASVRKPRRKSGKFRAGYIGNISYRLDFPLLFSTARQCPQVDFIFAGPVLTRGFPEETETARQIRALFRLQNVRYIGVLPKKEMPDLVGSFDAGLIPYDISIPFNRYSYPMKLFEYLAAGIPVISTPIAELQRYAGRIAVEHDSPGFVRRIRFLMGKGQNQAVPESPQDPVRLMSWSRRVRQILTFIPSA
jgi:glycosyltransferase involved in cell wall biosynthesis